MRKLGEFGGKKNKWTGFEFKHNSPVNNKECVVVIPVYKRILSNPEKESLLQVLNILWGKYEIVLLHGRNLDTTGYMISGFPISEAIINDAFFSSWYSYANLCETTEFYEMFSDYKFMLIYQLDAWIYEDNLKYFIDKDYDYVGSVHELYGIISVGNGGFSLRKNSSFIKVCKECPMVPNNDADDIVFSLHLKDRFNIAPIVDGIAFSFMFFTDACYAKNAHKLPMGCHSFKTREQCEKFVKIKNSSIQPEIIMPNEIVVWVYVLCYNTSQLAPFIIDYWKTYAKKVIIYDNGSTDGCLDLFAKYDWIEVRYFDDIDKGIEIKNNCWKEARLCGVDFVQVSDFNEVIYEENLAETLKKYKEREDYIFDMDYVDVICKNIPEHDENILLHKNEGLKFHNTHKTPSAFHKAIFFDPSKIEEINYQPDCRKSTPSILSELIIQTRTNTKILHFNEPYADFEHLVNGVMIKNFNELPNCEYDYIFYRNKKYGKKIPYSAKNNFIPLKIDIKETKDINRKKESIKIIRRIPPQKYLNKIRKR